MDEARGAAKEDEAFSGMKHAEQPRTGGSFEDGYRKGHQDGFEDGYRKGHQDGCVFGSGDIASAASSKGSEVGKGYKQDRGVSSKAKPY